MSGRSCGERGAHPHAFPGQVWLKGGKKDSDFEVSQGRFWNPEGRTLALTTRILLVLRAKMTSRFQAGTGLAPSNPPPLYFLPPTPYHTIFL